MCCDYDDLDNIGLLIDKYKESELTKRKFNLDTVFYMDIVSQYDNLYKYIENKKRNS